MDNQGLILLGVGILIGVTVVTTMILIQTLPKNANPTLSTYVAYPKGLN